MDTEPQPQPRPQLKILNSSGNPWVGTKVEINGRIYTTNNEGIISLIGFIGKRLNSLWIGGKRAIIEPIAILQGTQLTFQNCTRTRSSVQQILETTE